MNALFYTFIISKPISCRMPNEMRSTYDLAKHVTIAEHNRSETPKTRFYIAYSVWSRNHMIKWSEFKTDCIPLQTKPFKNIYREKTPTEYT